MEAVKHRTARSLVHRLTTATSNTSLVAALAEIRLLSKHDPDLRLPLADSGLVPILTHLLLLQHQNQDQNDDVIDEDHRLLILENAHATLLNLSISAPEPLMSAGPTLLPSLSLSLRLGPPVLAQHAAATLYSLLSVDAYRPIIGSKHDLILSPLLSLLRNPSSPTRSIKDALKPLFALAVYPLNRPPLVALGAVPALFSLVVNDGRAGIVEDASAVIAQVAGCYESVAAFRGVGGVRILVGLAAAEEEGRRARARENAVAALLNLAMSGGERAVGDIREVEDAEEAMRELAEKGSARARGKAGELLRVMDSGRGDWIRLIDGDRFSDQSAATRSSSSSMSVDVDTGSF